jgi:phosphoglycerate dehydrogenase-like enzyme
MKDSPRVLIHSDDSAPLAARLRARHPAIEVLECEDYDSLPETLRAARPQVVYTVRFAGARGYPRDALFASGGPAWIANGGAGVDHFGSWDPSRVTVTNAAGVAAGMMAEYVLGGFLHFTLDVPGLSADKAARIWRTRRVRPLAGETLLIIGLGHTGRALAERAAALGMTVIGTRARPRPMDNVAEVHPADALPALMPRARFVAVCTPLTDATRGLVDAACLAALPRGAVLADVSRGGVVDQTALARLLAEDHLAGAVLDVFETEPLPEDSPLWALPNLLISPHCSAVHADWERASLNLFLDNLDRWLRGDPLRNVVDPALGY